MQATLSAPTQLPFFVESPLVVWTVLAIAKKRLGLDLYRRWRILLWLREDGWRRRILPHLLEQRHLDERRFAVLAVLFALDQESTDIADLVSLARVNPAHTGVVLVALEQDGLVKCERRLPDGQIIGARLTASGWRTIDHTLEDVGRVAHETAPSDSEREQRICHSD